MTLQRHLRFAALILTVFSLGIPCGSAQTALPSPGGLPVPAAPGRIGSGGGTPGGAAASVAPVEDPGPRMDFQFSSVPLAEAIKNIQATYRTVAAPKSLNVVVPEHLHDLARTNTITLDVKQITVGEVLNLVGMSSQREISWRSLQQRTVGNFIEQVQQGRAGFSFIPVLSSGGNPTYVLRSDYPAGYSLIEPSTGSSSGGGISSAEPADSTSSKTILYYPLEQHLALFTVEDITTAIKIGWELAGVKNPPTMRFHEETKLLIVVGDQRQTQCVDQVLQRLSSNGPRQPGQPGVLSRPAQRSLPVPAAKP